MFRRFFQIFTNVNGHTHHKAYNDNFPNNCKKHWIYIHSLFNHQIKMTKPMVIPPFNIITNSLYCSTGKKIDAQKIPNVTWEKAIESWINEFLSFPLNFRIYIYFSKINFSQQGFIKVTKKSLISLLGVWVIIVSSGIFYLFGPQTKEAEAAWFDDNWAYRTPITIDGSADSNKKVKFDIDTSALVGASPSKMQSDCGDSRFTDANGNLLRYFIDTGNGACNGVSTDYYVLVPTFYSPSTIIYHYYGHSTIPNGTVAAQFSEATYTQTATTSGTEVKGPSPTLFWRFDDASGTTAQDVSSNGLDGSLTNTPTWKPNDLCISVKCLWFDGANNERASRADNALLDFSNTDNFTISSWVKHSGPASAAEYIITKADTTTGGYKLYMDASGDLCFAIDDDATWDPDVSACTSGIDFDDNQWHFAVGVRSVTDDNLYLYVDGVQRASASDTTAATLANTNIFYVGIDRDAASNEWLGFIDEVKVYRDDTGRTAAQVKADYASRVSDEGTTANFGSLNNPNAFSNGLVGYWTEDETTDGASATDSSGVATTLTDSGVVTRVVSKYYQGGDFESTSSQYQFAADNATLSITGSTTLAAWIRPEAIASGTYNIIAKWDGSNESYRLASIADGTDHEIRLELDSDGNYVQTSSSNLVASTWYHVVGVYDSKSATAKIYINGAEATSTTTGTIPSSIGDDGGRFHIGAEDSTTTAANFYDGIIDEVRVYSRGLSRNDVYALYDFGPGPIADWTMESSIFTTTITDFSSNGKTATKDSGPDWDTGKFGYGIDIGTNGPDNIFVDATSYWNPETITVEEWFKPSNATDANRYTISKGTATYAIRWWDGTAPTGCSSTQRLAFMVTIGGTNYCASIANPFSLNTWTHVGGTFDGSTVKLYVNGVLRASTAASGSIDTDTTNFFCIGSLGDTTDCRAGSRSSGIHDEVKVYNYARTPAQIVQDMNAGHPAPGSPIGSPVSYWKFDEGFGTSANDSSINANTLTLSSASWTDSGKFGKAWDGTGAIRLSRATDLDLEFSATEDFSISLWYKTDSASNPASTEYLISDTTANADVGFNIYANTDGTICFGIDDDATSAPPMDISSCTATDFYDGTWRYLTAIRDTSTDKIYLYIDSFLQDSDTDPTTATLDGNNTFFVGDIDTLDDGEEFTGDIDELKVYRLTLSASQIPIDMNRGSAQVLGALSDNSTYQKQAANQEYCIPGDSTSCAAPVGRWDFEENTGTTANDTSINGNSLTLTNTPTFTSGKYGAGINFAGSDQHLIRADDSDFDFAAGGSFTLEAYIRHEAASAQEIIMSKYEGAASEGGYKVLMESDGDITCGIDYDDTWTPADSVTSTAATYDDNLWHHIACVKNANTSLTLYIDGVSLGTPDTTLTNSTLANSDPLYIGIDADATSNDFIGKIDQVRIFNYARSAPQVAWDFNQGDPLGYWKFDECQGPTLNDSTGNSLTGTWSGTGAGVTSVGTCTTSSTAWGNGATGKRNNSLDFDGTDDVVTVTNASKIDFDEGLLNAVTFAAWIYADTDGEADTGQFIQKGTNTYLRVDSQSGSNLDVEASLDLATADATANVSAGITTASWNHIVVTYTDDADDEITIYINGISRATSTNGSGAPASTDTNDLLIGGVSTANFDGKIDDARIYNYELTATQVVALYNDGAIRFGPSTGAP